jgi:hypothetical protein
MIRIGKLYRQETHNATVSGSSYKSIEQLKPNITKAQTKRQSTGESMTLLSHHDQLYVNEQSQDILSNSKWMKQFKSDWWPPVEHTTSQSRAAGRGVGQRQLSDNGDVDNLKAGSHARSGDRSKKCLNMSMSKNRRTLNANTTIDWWHYNRTITVLNSTTAFDRPYATWHNSCQNHGRDYRIDCSVLQTPL